MAVLVGSDDQIASSVKVGATATRLAAIVVAIVPNFKTKPVSSPIVAASSDQPRSGLISRLFCRGGWGMHVFKSERCSECELRSI